MAARLVDERSKIRVAPRGVLPGLTQSDEREPGSDGLARVTFELLGHADDCRCSACRGDGS